MGGMAGDSDEDDVDYGGVVGGVGGGGTSNATDGDGFYSAYEVKEILGHGLASTVRRCIEKGTGTAFAVKIVDITTEKQSEMEASRLLDETISEVDLLRKLSGHPSIITIHDFYRTPSFLFAVFEMAPKGELFDQLNTSVTVSEKKARRLMRQLFDGVAYMHSHNILHRDLKLENILCIDDERIVISDFGFATQLLPAQKLKDLCGTPGYLAPETLRCQMYDDAPGYGIEVDEWALGVIMYTLIAGYAPFYHRRQLIMMRMIQEAKFEFRSEQWASVSDDAKQLIRALLTVKAEARPTAAACLRDPWMLVGTADRKQSVMARQANIREADLLKQPARNVRELWRVAIASVRFTVRIGNYKYLKMVVDREALRKRPYRDRQIRHESEAAVFSVYGHWVNRGFHYSRDLLFANRPRPKYKKVQDTPA